MSLWQRFSAVYQFKKPIYGLNLFRNITNGRATPLGTKYFLEQGKIPMVHTLKSSSLSIHPLILNMPMHPSSNRKILDSLYQGSILKYRTNCFHVYSRYSDGNIWYTRAVEEVVQSGIDREGLVTIAHVGKISHREELMNVLDEAWSVTDQEYIDIITLQYHHNWKEGHYGDYPSVVQFLEELCQKKIIHAYGFTLDLEPFNHHTPALGGHFNNTDIPIHMEVEIREKLPNCDLVFYPLSPTIALPTNTSLLPPEEESIHYENEESIIEASQEDFNEADRTFTRVACNPFSCYRGHGVEDEEDNEQEEESLAQKDPDALRAALEAEKQRDELEGKVEASGAPRPDDPVLFMIEKVLPPNIVEMLNDLLNRACPKLSSTPLLEDKVLRICLSYGHEVCTVQPEVLTLLDEFNLKKSDLLTLDEAGRVFGGFMIPQEIDDILREASHEADDEDSYDRYGRNYDMEKESDDDIEEVRQQYLQEKELEAGGRVEIPGRHENTSVKSQKSQKNARGRRSKKR